MGSINYKIILIVLTFFLMSCINNTPKPNDPNSIIIPQIDNTLPEVGMTINDNKTININVTDKDCPPPNPTPTEPAKDCPDIIHTDSNILSIIAGGTDSDGGIKSVKLWASSSRSRPGQTSGPGLAGRPVHQIDSNAKIGELTKKNSFFIHNLDIKAEIGNLNDTLILWTEVENFHGGVKKSLLMNIKYVR